jgi:uncharacterized protein (DUF58 family)
LVARYQYTDAVMFWAIAGALMAAVLFVDWLVAALRLGFGAKGSAKGSATGSAAFSVLRSSPATVPVGVAYQVRLTITNHTASAATLHFYDGHPDQAIPIGLPIVTTILASRVGQYQYSLTPTSRGDHFFSRLSLRLASPLGGWLLPFEAGETSQVRVFPNYAAVTRYALLAVDNRLSQIGLLKRRRRGEGMDFQQLRDHREGDSPRAIDWKATARHVKLISRQYQDERDQQVLFLLDCSRRMNAKDDSLSHFDHTLNAILLLTYVAIRQGDAAGLMTFGAAEDRYIAPKKSQATMSRFLHALYPLEPTLKAPDYYQAALQLGKRLNRRALIIVVSNVRDEDEDGLDAAMAQLQRRHLVLFANLKEAAIDVAASGVASSVANGASNFAPPQASVDLITDKVSDAALITFAAANQYAQLRDATLSRMRARGVRLLDVVPEKLPIALVNRYLDMKQSGVF